MRILIFFLLFANLAYFAWSQFIDEGEQSAAAPERTLEIPRLKLATEVGSPTTAGAPPRTGSRCVSVGPFRVQAVTDRAVLWLRSLRHEPRVRSTENEAGTAYWVSVSTSTLQQAAAISTRLKSEGVSDVGVIPPSTGGTQATVSLGVYTVRERADQRVAALKAHLVTATVTEQGHAVPVYWLDVDLAPGDRPVDVAAMQANLAGSESLVLETCPVLLPPASTAPAEPTAEGVAPAAPATN
jgi:hypothetical protein